MPTPSFFEDSLVSTPPSDHPLPTPPYDHPPSPFFHTPSPPLNEVPSFPSDSAPCSAPAPLRHSTRVINPPTFLKGYICTSASSAAPSKLSPHVSPFHEPQQF